MSDTSAADTPAPAVEVVQPPITSPHRRSRSRRGRSAAAMALQVVLIALGVFLGLAGEEWREDRENRRVAADTLRRFRAEITANREAVLAVKDYHTEQLADLNAFFAATTDEEKDAVTVQLAGIRPPRFEKTAWELALATGTLAYLDADLAFELSRTYGLQEMTNQLSTGVIEAMYLKPLPIDTEGFLAIVQLYYNDLSLFEPALIATYDALLAQLDAAPRSEPPPPARSQ